MTISTRLLEAGLPADRRPYADFVAAKAATATALAEAVCRAGWCIQSSAAQAIAASGILSKADSPPSSCRASLWGISSYIADPERCTGLDEVARATGTLVPLAYAVACTVRAARQDDKIAADMPTAYDWLEPLVA
jgi:hypothetical protein